MNGITQRTGVTQKNAEKRFLCLVSCLFLCDPVVSVLSVVAAAQVRYATGQDVVPVFEGWERNADGSFNMVFGYMNRNYEEEVDVPVGPDNALEPGGVDQGQPAHFYPRRQQYVFSVRVPKDWGKKDLRLDADEPRQDGEGATAR